MPRLSVIVPSLDGTVPPGLQKQVAGRGDVELVVVGGVSPVGKARNEGLSRAKGDYIAWVDADDEVTDGWLEEILPVLESRPDVIVIGHMWMVSPDYGFEKVWRGGDLMAAVLSQEVIRSEMWNYVVRRDLWQDIRFDDTARVLEDWDVIPRLLARTKAVCAIEKPLYLYRANGESLTHQVSLAFQEELRCRALGRIRLLRALGVWDRYRPAARLGIAQTLCANPKGRPWLRRNLPALLVSKSPLRRKAKWVLSALGLYGIVRWYYER